MLIKPNKLNFITAGMPLRTGKGGYSSAFEVLKEMNLDGMELEFVHGVRMSDDSKSFLKADNNFKFKRRRKDRCKCSKNN